MHKNATLCRLGPELYFFLTINLENIKPTFSIGDIVTETNVSRIEVQEREGGSGEEGKMALRPTSEMERVVTGAPEREVRGESGEGDETEDGGREGRGEDGMTGGALMMMTG